MEYIRNKYIWIALPYFFTVSVLYLWAYWASFQINVFEYAGLSDLAKVAIIPVGSAFFFILLGFFLGEYTPNPAYPQGGGRETVFGRFLIKTKWLWVSIYWFVILFLIFTDSPGKWRIIPIVGMIFPYIMLKNTGFLIEIRSDSIRSLLIMSACILPIYSFCQGRVDAYEIIDGKEYKYVESIAGIKNARFIGHVNQYLFFSSEDNSKVVFQRVTDKPLVLTKIALKIIQPNKPIQPTAKASTD